MAQAANADVQIRAKEKGAKAYKNVQERLDKLNSRVKQFGLLAGAAAVGGLAALTIKSFASADALAKQADRIGTSTTKLAALQHLTQLQGGSSENLSKSLQKANKALGEFNLTGSGTAAPFLKKMNFDTQALARLKPDELFNVYADAIRGLDNRSEQAAASAALFGDRTGEMLNLIDAGADALAASEEEVDKYGIALNRVDSAKIEAANDAVFKVKERFIGIGNVIASKVAPIVTAIANRFLDSGTEANVMGDIVDKVMMGIAVGAGIVADAVFGWKLLFQVIRIASLEFVAAVVGGYAKIERAIIIVKNKMSEAFGGEQIDVRSGFLTRVEDSLKASSKHAKQVLAELTASERPSEVIAREFEAAKIAAEQTAQATAAAREKLQAISTPDFKESASDEKAREREEAAQARLEEVLARKVAAIEQSLLSEEDREIQSHERRLEILLEAQESIGLSKERARDIEAGLAAKHEERLTKIALKAMSDRQKFEAKSGKDKAKQIFGDLANITAGVATHNKVLFRINQAAAIGNAIINTAEGVTKSLAAYPMPYAAIVAAVHLAAGLAQVATIRSAQPGGGTTPSIAATIPTFNDQPISPFGSGNDAGATAPVPGTQITIIVEGSLIGDEGIQQVLADTIGELVDQDVILIPPESTQAAVIREGSGSGG